MYNVNKKYIWQYITRLSVSTCGVASLLVGPLVLSRGGDRGALQVK